MHVQAALIEHLSSWWVQIMLQTWQTSSEELQAEKAHSWNTHYILFFPASIKKRVSSELINHPVHKIICYLEGK